MRKRHTRHRTGALAQPAAISAIVTRTRPSASTEIRPFCVFTPVLRRRGRRRIRRLDPMRPEIRPRLGRIVRRRPIRPRRARQLHLERIIRLPPQLTVFVIRRTVERIETRPSAMKSTTFFAAAAHAHDADTTRTSKTNQTRPIALRTHTELIQLPTKITINTPKNETLIIPNRPPSKHPAASLPPPLSRPHSPPRGTHVQDRIVRTKHAGSCMYRGQLIEGPRHKVVTNKEKEEQCRCPTARPAQSAHNHPRTAGKRKKRKHQTTFELPDVFRRGENSCSLYNRHSPFNFFNRFFRRPAPPPRQSLSAPRESCFCGTRHSNFPIRPRSLAHFPNSFQCNPPADTLSPASGAQLWYISTVQVP